MSKVYSRSWLSSNFLRNSITQTRLNPQYSSYFIIITVRRLIMQISISSQHCFYSNTISLKCPVQQDDSFAITFTKDPKYIKPILCIPLGIFLHMMRCFPLSFFGVKYRWKSIYIFICSKY